MQEIALLLSSVAGMCTAVALKKKSINTILAKNTSSNILNQKNNLIIEKDILTKTISRLQNDSRITKTQKDQLFIKYQHQLGIVLSRIENLEQINHQPSMESLQEGLSTVIEQKFSKIDSRLSELSSKINLVNMQEIVEKETLDNDKKTTEPKVIKRREKQPVEQPVEQRNLIQKNVEKENSGKKEILELTTLTTISDKVPEFFINDEKFRIKKDQVSIIKKNDVEEKIVEKGNKQVKNSSQEQKLDPKTNLPEDDDIEDDDIDKIKAEITKALSNLEQAEVE